MFCFYRYFLLSISILGDFKLVTGIQEYDSSTPITTDSGFNDTFCDNLKHIKSLNALNTYIQREHDKKDKRELVFNIFEIVKNRFVHPYDGYLKHTLFTNYIIYTMNILSEGRGLPLFFKHKTVNILFSFLLNQDIPDNWLMYTIRNSNRIMQHTYGACDQINQVLLDILIMNGFKVAILAVPEHTSSLVYLEDRWYIIDADREVNSLFFQECDIDTYLQNGEVEKLYTKHAIETNPLVASMFDRYRKKDYFIFPYDGTWDVVDVYNNFEKKLEYIKYLLAILFILLGLLLYPLKKNKNYVRNCRNIK